MSYEFVSWLSEMWHRLVVAIGTTRTSEHTAGLSECRVNASRVAVLRSLQATGVEINSVLLFSL